MLEEGHEPCCIVDFREGDVRTYRRPESETGTPMWIHHGHGTMVRLVAVQAINATRLDDLLELMRPELATVLDSTTRTNGTEATRLAASMTRRSVCLSPPSSMPLAHNRPRTRFRESGTLGCHGPTAASRGIQTNDRSKALVARLLTWHCPEDGRRMSGRARHSDVRAVADGHRGTDTRRPHSISRLPHERFRRRVFQYRTQSNSNSKSFDAWYLAASFDIESS